MRCLDVGCGTNPKSSPLFEDDQILLSDTAREITRYVHKQYPNRTVVQCNIEALPFTESSFEYVVAYHVLEHVKNPKRGLLEISQVLKKQGILQLAIPNGHSIIEVLNMVFGKIGGAQYDHLWQYSIEDFEKLLNSNFNVREKNQVRFFRTLIANITLHFSIMFSRSSTKHSYIYRAEVFSLEKQIFFNPIMLVIGRLDRFIIGITPSVGAEIEITAVKRIADPSNTESD